MKTGFRGTFVIPWVQTEVDGLVAVPVGALTIGSAWRWTGEAMRLDGPDNLLLLDNPEGAADMRRRAARKVQRLVGAATDPSKAAGDDRDAPLMDHGFIVTDGLKTFTATEIDAGPGRAPLLMFLNELPPVGTDLWVVRRIAELEVVTRQSDMPGGVICFATGTLIETPLGRVPVEILTEGSLINTLDDGPQRVLWIGRRKMSGARLCAMPYLRPIRIREGALGGDRPTGDLIVSPQHRVLIRGGAAELLFSTPEVLVAAEDLVNDTSIVVDRHLPEVTYIHLMLERHQVVWANGVETESFHPANTSLGTVSPEQRDRLLGFFPSLSLDPRSYGDFARRNLTAPEAAILQYQGGQRH